MTSTERQRAEEALNRRTEEALRASRKVIALIALLLAGVFVFCHGCHGGDHDDELVIHWLDGDR